MSLLTESTGFLLDSFFPVEEVSQEAIKEKKGRSPTFEMHFWWGRKPLIVARAAVLSSCLNMEDQEQFLQLIGLNSSSKDGRRAFNFSPKIDTLSKRYNSIFGKNKLTILDPFAGGGSIPYEALRLGHDVVAND